MYQVVERPLTEDERSQLLSCLSARPEVVPQWRRKLLLDLTVQVGGFGIAIIVLLWVKKEPASFVIPVVLAFWIMYWIVKINGLLLKPWREECKQNRATNQRLEEFGSALNAAKTIRVQRVEA